MQPSTKTLEEIISTVCEVLNISKEEIPIPRARSSREITDAKQLCTFFAKKYTKATNRNILAALGYNIMDTKMIRQNKVAVENAIQTAQFDDFCKHFKAIDDKLGNSNDRLYIHGEQLHLIVMLSNTADMRPVKLEEKGIHPFLVCVGGNTFSAYAYDKQGGYIGQSHIEHLMSIKAIAENKM